MTTVTITLRSGEVLTCGADHELWIARDGDVIRLPYPTAGYGGSELVVSVDERLAAMFIYSGQNEQGWELFSLAPLRHLGGLPYVIGTGGAPTFSPDSAWLAMFVAVDPTIRGTGEYAEEVLGAEDDSVVIVDWGRIYLQAMPDGAIQEVPVGTSVPRSTSFDHVLEWRSFDTVVWTDGALVLELPGGPVVVPLRDRAERFV